MVYTFLPKVVNI